MTDEAERKPYIRRRAVRDCIRRDQRKREHDDRKGREDCAGDESLSFHELRTQFFDSRYACANAYVDVTIAQNAVKTTPMQSSTTPNPAT